MRITIDIELVNGGRDAKILIQHPPKTSMSEMGWAAVELLAFCGKTMGAQFPDAIDNLAGLAKDRVRTLVIAPNGPIGQEANNS
jgi:hypothetical protein